MGLIAGAVVGWVSAGWVPAGRVDCVAASVAREASSSSGWVASAVAATSAGSVVGAVVGAAAALGVGWVTGSVVGPVPGRVIADFRVLGFFSPLASSLEPSRKSTFISPAVATVCSPSRMRTWSLKVARYGGWGLRAGLV